MSNPIGGTPFLPLYFGLNKNLLPARLKDGERDQISVAVIERLEELAAEREAKQKAPWGVTAWRYSPATFSPVFTLKMTPPEHKKNEPEIKDTISREISETLDRAYSGIFQKDWKHPDIKINIIFEEVDGANQKPSEGCCWLKDLFTNNWADRPRKFPLESNTNVCAGCSVPPESDAPEETKSQHIKPRPLQKQLRRVNLFA